ncbi:DUF6247 family protein [Streptomyces specialis]|uniref:DUF6247 family protein n=1 Tax=Streptomyces specialis TaxID=498367 RepID=UPI00073EF6FC|nr:DUF6247 family protein [Streptomyces specialis]
MSELDDLSRVDGSWVWQRLDDGQLREFAEDFRFALKGVRLTYEVEPLAEVVRTWWTVVGGPTDAADADRWRSLQDATITRRPHPPQQDFTRWVDRTGPAIRAALPDSARTDFERAFGDALWACEQYWDHRHLLRVLHDWWPVAHQTANPEQMEKDLATARRVQAGDTGMMIPRARTS